MRIALLGTRGIPNSYGGFEEFAEFVSLNWVNAGHEVFVYCVDSKDKINLDIKGLHQVFIKEGRSAFFSQMYYDYLCTKHAIGLGLDIFYHAGYATSVLPNILFHTRLKGRLVYNMDGLEWKRSKFNFFTRFIIRFLERIAVLSCKHLVADNRGIGEYLKEVYNATPTIIEYGVNPDSEISNISLGNFNVYDLVIARFEPENNLESILSVYEECKSVNLVIVANTNTQLYKSYKFLLSNSPNILFLGPCYDRKILNGLRASCRYYIHGHSVGGTNPSLVDALASGCQILAHKNVFNEDVAKSFGKYWSNKSELLSLVLKESNISEERIASQMLYTRDRFNWLKIANEHLKLFSTIIKS